MYVLRCADCDRYYGHDGLWRDRDGARRYGSKALALAATLCISCNLVIVKLGDDEPDFASW